MQTLNAKIVMLKGEKGDVGQPTDTQIEAVIAKYIQEHPEVTIDEALIQQTATNWLDTHDVGEISNAEIDNALK